MSVAAATALMTLKLVTGLATGSLGILSEAVHSGTDLVASLLTFFAIGVAGRPADSGHPYGHGKAEHLAALAEGAFLALVAVLIGFRAIQRLTGTGAAEVDAAWWAFAVLGVVIAIDITRTLVSLRTARRFKSAALLSNALHFGSDLVGSIAVLVGLLARPRRLPGRRLDRRALRRRARARRGRAADAAERRRADGPGSGRRARGGAAAIGSDRAGASSCAGCACARPAGATSRTS